jgi:hypothetical protein
MVKQHRRFCCFFFFVGWSSISFGLSLDVFSPNIEIHLPFGFFRAGWEMTFPMPSLNASETNRRVFGLHYWTDERIRTYIEADLPVFFKQIME